VDFLDPPILQPQTNNPSGATTKPFPLPQIGTPVNSHLGPRTPYQVQTTGTETDGKDNALVAFRVHYGRYASTSALERTLIRVPTQQLLSLYPLPRLPSPQTDSLPFGEIAPAKKHPRSVPTAAVFRTKGRGEGWGEGC